LPPWCEPFSLQVDLEAALQQLHHVSVSLHRRFPWTERASTNYAAPRDAILGSAGLLSCLKKLTNQQLPAITE